MNPELARRNLRFGWALFVLFWLIFAGTILVAVCISNWTSPSRKTGFRLAPDSGRAESLKASASRPRRI